MTPFICPNCSSQTWKLVAQRDATEQSKDKLACPNCFDRKNMRPSYLHQLMEGAMAKGLTEAKSRVIGRRIISPEDHMTVIDKKTGKETQY